MSDLRATSGQGAPGRRLSVGAVARAALAAGISVFPPKEDGTKAPMGAWKRYQSERPTLVQVELWYGSRNGLGFITGPISGGLELFELDADFYAEFRATADAVGLGPLLDRIEAGYLERSPSGGWHWLYRCDDVRGNTVLAQKPGPPDPKTGRPTAEVLIETRGEGGYVVVAPSNGKVHPSGGRYELLKGGVEHIATIAGGERDQLWGLARTFDRMPVVPVPAPAPAPGHRGEALRPGDDYNGRVSWDDLLTPHGWIRLYTRGGTAYWRRPGKSEGWSATTNHNGSGLLWVFTTSSEFEANRSYDRFGAYALLEHAGVLEEAARCLRKLGYGSPVPDPARLAPAPTPPGGEGREPGDDDPWDGEDPDAWLPPDEEVLSVRMSEVGRREVRWLFPDRIPIGKVTLIAGDPGLGKSFLTIDLMARVTTGGAVPAGDGECVPQGPVVLLSAEDDLADTVGPRLDAAGADAGQVHVLTTLVMPGGRREPFNLSYMPHLERVIVRAGRPKLVVIDPVTAYIGQADDHKNSSLRAVLGPLSEMATRREVAVVIVTHLNKSSGSKALARITGSLAYVALARVAWLVARDPDDPDRRLFLSVKNNLAPEPPGLSYRIDRATMRIVWGDDPVLMTANEALRANDDQDRSRDKDGGAPRGGRAEEARMFLVEALADGKELTHDELVAMAFARGIAKNAIFEARGPAGVRPRKAGYQGKWYWSIPVPAPIEEADPPIF